MSLMDTAQLLGNLGEFFGAVVIVATLIYLAMQVRQNTIAMRTRAEQEYAQHILDFYHPIALDRQTAEWWAKGAEDFSALDSIDQQRLMLWEISGFRLWFFLYLARQRGLVTDEFWENLQSSIRRFGKRASVRVAWRDVKQSYDAEFRQWMDEFFHD